MPVMYLIRHGQAGLTEDDYDQLSRLGFQQAQKLGEQFGRIGLAPDRIVVGAMRRHRETAETALKAMGLPTEWETDARLNEYDHEEVLQNHWPLFADKPGVRSWFKTQQQPVKTFGHIFTQAIEHWQQGTYEYEEDWQAFCARVESVFSALCDSAEGSVLVFTSGGVISVILKHLLALETESFQAFSRMLGNTGVTRIVLSQGKVRIGSVNELLHLPEEMVTSH